MYAQSHAGWSEKAPNTEVISSQGRGFVMFRFTEFSNSGSETPLLFEEFCNLFVVSYLLSSNMVFWVKIMESFLQDWQAWRLELLLVICASSEHSLCLLQPLSSLLGSSAMENPCFRSVLDLAIRSEVRRLHECGFQGRLYKPECF